MQLLVRSGWVRLDCCQMDRVAVSVDYRSLSFSVYRHSLPNYFFVSFSRQPHGNVVVVLFIVQA